MPLFYFDVYDGLSGLDRVGKDCLDHDAARHEAWCRAERLLADQEDWFRTGQNWQIGIFDNEGASIFILYFRPSADTAISTRDDCGYSIRFTVMEPMTLSVTSACQQAI